MTDDVEPAIYALRGNREVEEYVRKGSPDFEVSFSEKMAVLMMAEVVALMAYKKEAATEGTGPVFGLCALEYDFFGPAYTSFTPISKEDAQELYRFYERDQDNGRDAWFCRFYKHIPWNRMKERIESGGKWDCGDLAAGVVPADLANCIKTDDDASLPKATTTP